MELEATDLCDHPDQHDPDEYPIAVDPNDFESVEVLLDLFRRDHRILIADIDDL